MLSRDPLCHVHCAVAVHLDDDDRDVAALNHRLELARVPSPDATSVEFDGMTLRGGPPGDLRFMALEASNDRDAHGSPLVPADNTAPRRGRSVRRPHVYYSRRA
jgi:hypothetical protein